MKKRALLSVSDKSGITEFAQELQNLGYEIISTGGTLDTLKKAGVNAISITQITQFPECLDGRVKTLHPAVHAGLLAKRSNPEHMAKLVELSINTIDIVAVNLYPFAAAVARGADFDETVENIDIGGPTMLRSAAKNADEVLVVVDPCDYLNVISRLKSGDCDKAFRLNLMYKVYRHTAVYDTMIANYLQKQAGIELPSQISMAFNKVQPLRYGENPHQKAAFYAEINAPKNTLAGFEQLQGKELSFLNLYDANAAVELVKEFNAAAAVAVKHAFPCGVALGDNALDAYLRAYSCDPVSIYGGIVAINREVDARLADRLTQIFLEVVIAPCFSAEALDIFTKKPNLRVLKLADLDKKPVPHYDYKRVTGGLLVQESDNLFADEIKVVTAKQPTPEQLKQLEFAMKVVKHVKSNAIVVCAGNAAIGISGGETNRIWATKQALERAQKRLDELGKLSKLGELGELSKGDLQLVAASDAFFPFGDCAQLLCSGGVTAIIQPGGSIRDNESIETCNKFGVSMVFTGTRHFKH